MKRWAKDAIKALEAHGYEFDRVNAKGFHVYVNGAAEVAVNPSVDEYGARLIVKNLQRAHGTAPKASKRNPAEIRKRQAKQRDALRAEIERDKVEFAAMAARRARRLGGIGDLVSEAELIAIAARIEERERELHRIEALMRHQSLGNVARHRA